MGPGESRENYAKTLVRLGKLQEAESVVRDLIGSGWFGSVDHQFGDLVAVLIGAGSLELACDVLHCVLSVDPDCLQARYCLALLCYHQGNFDQSSRVLEEVVAAGGTDPRSLWLLGLALSEQGRNQDAISAFVRALQIRPRFPELLLRLGGIYRLLGEKRKAFEALSKAVEITPLSSAALFELGIVRYELGDWRAGIDLFREAIAIDPSCAQAYVDLGKMLQRKTPVDVVAVQELYCKSLVLDCRNAVAVNELGLVYAARGNSLDARKLYQLALRLRPDYVEAMVNIGNTYAEIGRDDLARAWYGDAMALDPLNPSIYYNQAVSYHRNRDIPSALECYRKSLALRPDDCECRLNVSVCSFYLNDYERGWQEYECRLETIQYRRLCAEPAERLPRWDGSPLNPATALVLVAEQGLGDSFQFVRYAAQLSSQGTEVVLCVPDALVKLYEASSLASRVISPDQLSALADGVWLPMLSLPMHLGVAPERPLIADPYLVVDEEKLRYWRSRLSEACRPIVAVHWQGKPDAEVHFLRGRSFPLETLRPLVDGFEISLVSLQKGPGSEQLAACSFRDRFVACQEEIDACWDFQDAAAILACCDLVITSDSGLAHLAGAIGAPTWLLLHRIPDWRWGLEGERTFWYPSMRLFRQVSQDDWAGVVEQVAAALEHEPGFTRRQPPASGFLSAFWSWVEQGEVVASPPPPSRPRRHRLSATISSFWSWLEVSQDPSEPSLEAETEEPDFPSQAMPNWPLPADLPDLPDLNEIRRDLARQCLQRAQLDTARRLWQELLDAGHATADDYAGLGAVSLIEDQYEAAVESLEKALTLRPDHPQTLSNLGLACFQLGEIDRARSLLAQAIKLKPDSAASYCNLALLQQSSGDVRQAIASYRQALNLDSSLVSAHWHLAHSLFLIGAYLEAWPEHEWRLQDAPERKLQVMPLAPHLEFSNEALQQDGSLLLVSEQGIGDTLQFIRYVNLLQASGRQISLCLPDPLHSLVGFAFPDIQLLSPDQGRYWSDGAWLSLMSVPGLLQDSPANPLVSEPYLRAAPAQVAAWTDILGAEQPDQPLVAINWQGNPAAEVGPLKGRSFPLQALAPLAALADVRFVSLQKGSGAEQLDDCGFRDRFIPAQPMVDEAWDFLDTAAILACCDLLITSDTALAHLAGALGRPTWLLLHHIPDWRWGLEGDNTFWYPSMRLFRQREAGNWDELIVRVMHALLQFKESR